MPLEIIDQNIFRTICDSVSDKSFMQSAEMGNLLEKRGFQVSYLAFRVDNVIQVAAILYSLPMTGGYHMEINSGPISFL